MNPRPLLDSGSLYLGKTHSGSRVLLDYAYGGDGQVWPPGHHKSTYQPGWFR